MRSSISSDRARSFTFRTVGAYYSNVMQSVWPRLALRSYGEGANMAKMAVPLTTTRVNNTLYPGKVLVNYGALHRSVVVPQRIRRVCLLLLRVDATRPSR